MNDINYTEGFMEITLDDENFIKLMEKLKEFHYTFDDYMKFNQCLVEANVRFDQKEKTNHEFEIFHKKVRETGIFRQKGGNK